MKRFLLYFHTLKYLKLKQIYYRFWYFFYRVRVSREIHSCDVSNIKDNKSAQFILKDKIYFKDNTAFFLNHTADISDKKIWNDLSQTRLWLYNLHYFDALLSQDITQKKIAYKLLERWIDENSPLNGIGWEPFPASLRIVNMIKYALSGNPLSQKITQSLYLQARFLNKKCEYHLLGNHLFENFKALCIAGLFFDTDESKKWFQKGFRGLQNEMKEQVLVDGGHFELSPMYHALFLEGLLDLQTIFSVYEVQLIWKETIEKMLSWLNAMKRSSQEISYFNDSANGIAATPATLFSYAKKLEYFIEPKNGAHIHLAQSGYIIARTDRMKIILDVGDIGPDCLPGHGHADVLSFELMVDDIPVFVNLGTSCYGNSARRLFERGTSAHNTLVLNNQPSSEVWGGFRVARRARVNDLSISENKNSVTVQAQHNGYRRIKKNLLHKRVLEVSKNKIRVTDFLNHEMNHVSIYFHLHPDCEILSSDEKRAIIKLKNNQCVQFEALGNFQVIESQYADTFGVLRDTRSFITDIKSSACFSLV